MYFSNNCHRTGLKQLLVVSEGGIQQSARNLLNQKSGLFIGTHTNYTVTLITTCLLYTSANRDSRDATNMPIQLGKVQYQNQY